MTALVINRDADITDRLSASEGKRGFKVLFGPDGLITNSESRRAAVLFALTSPPFRFKAKAHVAKMV